ncbi:uncharacterized protein LOC142537358 [Primulina tabacum]|uniref:uncharacterized protein LOC142537358 n=1 Tax=Primulina tabacum TaxID=48773 RepID=UPI003F5A79BF
MGKTYVVFIGRKPGVYETWEEAQKQVNKFSGASHRSFLSREGAIKAFDSYMDKQALVQDSSSTNTVEETSNTTSSANSNASASTKPTQAGKLDKLNEALSNLVKITEEIKQQIESLKISGDDN